MKWLTVLLFLFIFLVGYGFALPKDCGPLVPSLGKAPKGVRVNDNKIWMPPYTTHDGRCIEGYYIDLSKKRRLGLVDLLPEDTSKNIKDLVEFFDIAWKVILAGGVFFLARKIFRRSRNKSIS